MERLWKFEDEGKELEFYQFEVAPHLFLFLMERLYPKTVAEMKAWAEHAGYPENNECAEFLRGFSPPAPALSRQQRRALARKNAKRTLH